MFVVVCDQSLTFVFILLRIAFEDSFTDNQVLSHFHVYMVIVAISDACVKNHWVHIFLEIVYAFHKHFQIKL